MTFCTLIYIYILHFLRLAEKRGRKRGRTRILTDTPEKDQLEREAAERSSKKKTQPQKKSKKTKVAQALEQSIDVGLQSESRRPVSRRLDDQLKLTAPKQAAERSSLKKKRVDKPTTQSLRKTRQRKQLTTLRPAVERPVLPRKPTWLSDQQRPAGRSIGSD